jgi:hypothetical protein
VLHICIAMYIPRYYPIKDRHLCAVSLVWEKAEQCFLKLHISGRYFAVHIKFEGQSGRLRGI